MIWTGDKKGFRAWLIVVSLSLVAAFGVPYGIVTHFGPSLAVYGVWTIFGLAVAGFIFWGVRSWDDSE